MFLTQEASDTIYMFRREGAPMKTLPDLTIFRSGHEFWSIGEKPSAFKDWFKVYLRKNTEPERIFSGMSLAFMSQVIYIKDNDNWKCAKNRFITPPQMPFSSLEEARLKSAAAGWPEPVRIH